MKKILGALLLAATLASLTACGDAAQQEPQQAALEPMQGTSGIDVDLTALSSTMVYSEVYNMVVAPESYVGKTVKMKGQFIYYEDSRTENQHFGCVIADATACCSQGLEFLLAGSHTYPDDYPELYSEITVVGTFDKYGRIADAALVG